MEPKSPPVGDRFFLLGVPLAGSRQLTDSERQRLRTLAGVTAATSGLGTGILTLLPLFYPGTYMSDLLVLASLTLVPTFPLFGQSAWRAVYRNRLDIYAGRLRRFDAFDRLSRQVERLEDEGEPVEIIAAGGMPVRIGGGDADLWVMALYRPVRISASGGDELTDSERTELRQSAWRLFLSPRLGMAALAFAAVGAFYGSFAPDGIIAALVIALFSIGRRWHYAYALLRDANAGRTKNGVLPSGIVWTTHGEPARWRLARGRGAPVPTRRQVAHVERSVAARKPPELGSRSAHG